MSNINKLYTIHRLDRLTSGLIILGKTSSVAKSYSKCIMERSCQKIYLARVAGKFPLKYRNLKKLNSKQFLKSGTPLNGEWREETTVDDEERTTQNQQTTTVSKEKATSNAISRLRKQHALASWIENEKGKPVFEDDNDSHTDILEQVFQCRHRCVSIILLLLSFVIIAIITMLLILLVSLIYLFYSVEDWLKSIDTTLEGKEERGDKLWFHLACPTRIAKHKDGICEASSFDDLEDELYKKTVKPAHSSFGVVSYDQTTDSTLLVRYKYEIVLCVITVRNSLWRSYTSRFCLLIPFPLDLSTLYWPHPSTSSTLTAFRTPHCQ